MPNRMARPETGRTHDHHGPAKPAKPAAAPGAIYTCPMHPEIEQVGPGACPNCGMALEPREVSLAEEAHPELVDMTRRFWVGVALSVPVLLLAMGDLIPGRP
ncbi:MAG: heavy metal-binding domain-containing protein, partial [Alphaproteobacteria bacterium]